MKPSMHHLYTLIWLRQRDLERQKNKANEENKKIKTIKTNIENKEIKKDVKKESSNEDIERLLLIM